MDVVHLEIGEPDAATPCPHRRRRPGGPGQGPDPLRARPRDPGAAHGRGRVPGTDGPAAHQPRTGWWSPPGPSRSCSSPSWPCASPATRSSTPTPGSRCTSRSPPSPAPARSRCRCARPTRFRMDPAELASLVTDRTRLVILNSPHNPCGSGLTQDDVEAIAAVAIERDLVVLSDEVYWAIRYGGGHPSVLSVDGMAERTVLLDGWSKTFAMTGWRLGFGVLPGPPGRAGDPAGGQLRLLHRRLQPARRHRRPRGPVGAGRGDGGVAAGAPRPGRGRPERDRRHHLPGAGRRLLRLPPGRRPGPARRRAGRPAPGRGRRGPACPAPPSAPTARATCACRTPPPPTTCAGAWSGSSGSRPPFPGPEPAPVTRPGWRRGRPRTGARRSRRWRRSCG